LAKRHAPLSLDALYEAGRSAFEHGEFLEAEKRAETGYELSRDTSPEWAWRFRVLKAEALVWRGMGKDAVPLLSEEPPAGISSETAIRRKLALGLADSHLQRFVEADQLFQDAYALSSFREPALLGEVFLAQGVSAMIRSNYTEANNSYFKALRLARQ